MSQPIDTATVVRHVAHELRQPLSTIESIAYYLELILPADQPRARQQVQKLQELVEQSNWIVSNAANFVQACAPELEEIDIEQFIAPMVADAAEDSGPAIHALVHAISINMDPYQAQHLFRNVLTFFRQIAINEYPVEVEASTNDAWVTIDIRTGTPGYSAREVKSMFEPFSSGLPAGSGLSLASVRRIIAAHGGTVDVMAHPRTGVAVRIELPR